MDRTAKSIKHKHFGKAWVLWDNVSNLVSKLSNNVVRATSDSLLYNDDIAMPDSVFNTRMYRNELYVLAVRISTTFSMTMKPLRIAWQLQRWKDRSEIT